MATHLFLTDFPPNWQTGDLIESTNPEYAGAVAAGAPLIPWSGSSGQQRAVAGFQAHRRVHGPRTPDLDGYLGANLGMPGAGLNRYLVGPDGSGAPFTGFQAAIDQTRADGFVTSTNQALVTALPGTYVGDISIVGPGCLVAGLTGPSGDGRSGSALVRGRITINMGENPDTEINANIISLTGIGVMRTTGDETGPAITITGSGADLISLSAVNILTQATGEVAIRSIKPGGVLVLLSDPTTFIQANKGVAVDLATDASLQVLKFEGPVKTLLSGGGDAITGSSRFLEIYGEVNGRIVVTGGDCWVRSTELAESGAAVADVAAGATLHITNSSIECDQTPCITGSGTVRHGNVTLAGSGSGLAGTLTNTPLPDLS